MSWISEQITEKKNMAENHAGGAGLCFVLQAVFYLMCQVPIFVAGSTDSCQQWVLLTIAWLSGTFSLTAASFYGLNDSRAHHFLAYFNF